MKRGPIVLALAALTAGVAEASAQMKPLGIEVRAGFSHPLQELRSGLGSIGGQPAAPAKTDNSYGVDLYWTFHRYGAAYLGYNWVEFDCDDDLCGEDGNMDSRGFEFGFKLSLERDRNFTPWLRLGGFGHKFTFTEGDIVERSNRPIGYEVALGTDLRMGQFALVPAVRYHSYDPALDLATTGNQPRDRKDVAWFQTDLGLLWRWR